MFTKSVTYNYIIPAYGYTSVAEPIARRMADDLFSPQGQWEIKASDAFVTLFFSRPQDCLTFNAAWLAKTAAFPYFNKFQRPLYTAQEHMVSSAAPQPAVIPDVPMAPISEYLRIGPRGGMNRDYAFDYGYHSPETFGNAVRTDPRSRFTSGAEMGGLRTVQWNAATVVHERMVRTMLWTREPTRPTYSRNWTGMNLLRHHFVQGSPLESPDDEVIGNVYFLLSETWKPFTDIDTTNIPRASDFHEVARERFSGWWHATAIENGWRVFCDNPTELTIAKMALSQ